VAPLLGNRCCHGNHVVPHSLGGPPHDSLPSQYEGDVTTHNGVMAHFTCIHYMPVWPRCLTYYTKIGSCDQDPMFKVYACFEVYRPLRFFKYSIIKCRFRGPVARQPLLPWQPFCAPLVGGFVLMLASKYELDATTQYWVTTVLPGYVTWRCDLDLWPFDLRVMSRDATWVANPCT